MQASSGFIPTLMSASPQQKHSRETARSSRPITHRPELVGGVPLWLATRAKRAFTRSAHSTPATTLREVANIVEASDAELEALRSEVVRLQRALDARVGGDTEHAVSHITARLFNHVCCMQTKAAKMERELRELRVSLHSLSSQRDGYKDDFVMVSVALLAMLVVYFGYVTTGRDVFAGVLGGGV